MKGGKRSNRPSVGRESVHSLLPNHANYVRTALEKMEPHERVEAYIEMIATHPMNDHDAEDLQMFKDIFRELYPHDLADAKSAAYAVPSWETTTKDDFARSSIYNLLKDGMKGGNTRRNRNRKRRGRGRRSLKHYSKRR